MEVALWRNGGVRSVMVCVWLCAMARALLHTPQSVLPGDETLRAGVGAAGAVLAADRRPYCSLLLSHAHTTPSAISQAVRQIDAEWGSAVLEARTRRLNHNATHRQLSTLLHRARQGVREWWCVTFLVVSDDPDFTAGWTNLALKDGLLVWPTRLLVLTSRPITHSTSLHHALSQVNALTLSCQESCRVLSHLPYSSQVVQVAKWSSRRGLTLNSHLPLFPQKFRKFVERPVLLTTAEEFPPHIVVREKEGVAGAGTEVRAGAFKAGEVPGNKYIFSGAMKQVADVLAASMNFSYIIHRPPDGSFGTKLPDGTASGMVGLVGRQEVNFGLGPFGITAARAEIVDYTAPVVSDFLRIVGGRGLPEVDPWGFLLPFSPTVWAAILGALVLLLVTVVTLASCFSLDIPDLAPYVRVLLQENTILPDMREWERPLLGAWMVVMLVMTQSYSGILMSLLAVRYIPQPFQTLRILLDHPATTMIWEYDTAYVHHFRTTELGILREVREVDAVGGISYVLATDYPAMLRQQVRPGSHVFIGEHLTATVLMAQQFSQTGQCDYYTSHEAFMPFIYCMIGPKHSPLVPALSQRVRWLTEAGLYDHWMKNVVGNSTVCLRPPTSITVRTTLSLTNLWGVFAVLGVGCLLGLLAFCLEAAWLRCGPSLTLTLISPSSTPPPSGSHMP